MFFGKLKIPQYKILINRHSLIRSYSFVSGLAGSNSRKTGKYPFNASAFTMRTCE